MQLLSVAPKSINKFLHTFIATYKNKDGELKEYEVITRNKKLNINNFGRNAKVDAVGIIMMSKDGSHILLQKEFRLACNCWVYNFPGGLIDAGETPTDAAKRELKEETGLNVVSITKVLAPSYTAVGITDESVVTVIGKADGKFGKSTSADEEIEAAWYSKEDIAELIAIGAPMSLRTQSFLYMWSKETL